MNIPQTWSYWLHNIAEIQKSHSEVIVFCAIQTDARGLAPFKPLIDFLNSIGGKYWSYSLDDERTAVTVSNRYRHICAGRNLITDFAVTHRASHVLFLDADACPPVDVIPKLLEVNFPIVGGYLKTYNMRGPLMPEYTFPVMDCEGSAGCFLVEEKVFKIVRWRWEYGRTDDPCYIQDATRLGYKIRIREDVQVDHFPQIISPLESRFGTNFDFSVVRS
jgi:hypothetical protein